VHVDRWKCRINICVKRDRGSGGVRVREQHRDTERYIQRQLYIGSEGERDREIERTTREGIYYRPDCSQSVFDMCLRERERLQAMLREKEREREREREREKNKSTDQTTAEHYLMICDRERDYSPCYSQQLFDL